ncbi:MAG TPA: TetR/AcrR family transcriptional regulator, partial [Chryseobacterium sp.]|nr:TetR/AcrR family transcriptional regulator [Chryseobacterium sp.]
MDKKFLEKVVELFIDNGAKTLTMDDIAKEFGMSKKTLYQKYANKEALLEDVLAFKLEE